MFDIRRPTLDEIPAIAALEAEVYAADCYSPVAIRQFFDTAGPCLQIAVQGTSPVGYALVLRAYEPDEGWILALVVSHEHRGHGIGRSLAARTIELAATAGMTTLRLTVDASNTAAASLYASLGFHLERQESEYFGVSEPRSVLRRDHPRLPAA